MIRDVLADDLVLWHSEEMSSAPAGHHDRAFVIGYKDAVADMFEYHGSARLGGHPSSDVTQVRQEHALAIDVDGPDV